MEFYRNLPLQIDTERVQLYNIALKASAYIHRISIWESGLSYIYRDTMF